MSEYPETHYDCPMVQIDYTNHRGERAVRWIQPTRRWWGTTDYYPEPQWLIDATDVSKQEPRTFAEKGIHQWRGLWLTGPIQNRDVVRERVEKLLKEVEGHRADGHKVTSLEWVVECLDEVLNVEHT